MEDKGGKKVATVLFLSFAFLFFLTMITVNVVQAHKTGCGLGTHNHILERAEYRHFYKNLAERATGSDGLRADLPYCGSHSK
jgi:hypothetical protein